MTLYKTEQSHLKSLPLLNQTNNGHQSHVALGLCLADHGHALLAHFQHLFEIFLLPSSMKSMRLKLIKNNEQEQD